MTALIATDLDGTVLYSGRAVAADAAPVSVDPVAAGVMTGHTARTWARLAGAGRVVPVTTRSVQQYLRLRLPGAAPRYAIVCNGARLLVDGVTDPCWQRVVRRSLAGPAAGFHEIWDTAATWPRRYPFRLVRAVEDFFVYLTVPVRQPWLADFAAEAAGWAADRGWRASLQGRKLYLVPAPLDKATAVGHLADRLSAGAVVAGGDSLLDAEMLRRADAAIRPAHGELHSTGFTAPHCAVTAAAGASAGDEIVSWYADRAGLPAAPAGTHERSS